MAVKALLDSRATGLFMNTTFAKEKGFKMEKLKKPLLVRNVDGTVNAGGGHNTPGRVQYILQRTYGEGKNGCMQFGQNGVDTGNAVANSLQSRNRLGKRGSENDTLPTYIWKKKAKRKGEESKKNGKGQEQESIKKTGTQKILEVEKSIQEREPERMPVQKAWDHAIELKEGFIPKKGKVYSLSREEREEVQAFVEDQLRKGYI